jgi:hypothetical protein
MPPPTAIPAIAPLARCVPLAVFLSLEDDELGELPLGELLSGEVPPKLQLEPKKCLPK